VVVVDTNVLVYAANAGVPEHRACLQLVERLRHEAEPWRLTWGVLYEFLRVVTHPRVFDTPWSTPDAWGFIDALLASPSVDVLVETDRHRDVMVRVLRESPGVAGNLLHDLHTVALMREHGVRRIYTRDTDFHRFPSIEVLDPLSA
jgi:toxin-antitoxin system PIN domain toxin